VRADGVISGKNIGGPFVLGEDGLPLAKSVGRVEILDGTTSFASGGFIKDGWFALGTLTLPGVHTDRFAPLIVRCWDSRVGATFDDAVIAGHGFGYTKVNAELVFGLPPPVDLVTDGFQGIQLLKENPVPYWVRFEELLELPDLANSLPVLVASRKLLFARSAIASFRIEVTQPISLSINVQESQFLDPLIRVFDTFGNEVARGDGLNTTETARASGLGGSLQLNLTQPGRYHLAISSRSNGAYLFFRNTGVVSGNAFGFFDLSAARGIHGEVSTAVPQPVNPVFTHVPVDLFRFQSSERPVAGTPTWLLIHGWNSSSYQDELRDLATNIARLRPQDQILLLDWSRVATSAWTDPYTPSAGIVPVARWLVSALGQLGIEGTNLNFIGHSYGAYVANAAARRIPGGVNSIVALDPSALVPDAEPDVQFRQHARSSWAFMGSGAGSESAPVTAAEAYGVQFAVNSMFPNPNLFNALRDAFDGRYTYPNLFLIDRLMDGSPGPLALDQFSFGIRSETGTPGYEGILREKYQQGFWVLRLEYAPVLEPPPISLERRPGILSVRVGRNWSPSNTLYQSPDLKTWTNSLNQRLDFIYTNRVFEFPDTNGVSLFFKVE
jgi:pimeloyl-ACP methyl ester carboxylesterase